MIRRPPRSTRTDTLFPTRRSSDLRCSNARAYLRRAERRDNLAVVTDAHVTRVLLENRRAVGVQARCGRRLREFHARREVVLSAGAFGSPQLLMLSGIGPRDELDRKSVV